MSSGGTDSRSAREQLLADAIAGLRRQRGETAVSSVVAALVICVEFVRDEGHGNVTLSVRDHRVGPLVKLESYRAAGPAARHEEK